MQYLSTGTSCLLWSDDEIPEWLPIVLEACQCVCLRHSKNLYTVLAPMCWCQVCWNVQQNFWAGSGLFLSKCGQHSKNSPSKGRWMSLNFSKPTGRAWRPELIGSCCGKPLCLASQDLSGGNRLEPATARGAPSYFSLPLKPSAPLQTITRTQYRP